MATLTPSIPSVLGPVTTGHYIQIGMGLGFYVPESDYQLAKRTANATHRVQFLGVTLGGDPIHASREEILNREDSAGLVAWILPDGGAL